MRHQIRSEFDDTQDQDQAQDQQAAPANPRPRRCLGDDAIRSGHPLYAGAACYRDKVAEPQAHSLDRHRAHPATRTEGRLT